MFFDATAELFLEVLKQKGNIPKDAIVVRVEADPPWREIPGPSNAIRLWIESETFPKVLEGEVASRFEPRWEPKWETQKG